ncbi:MAG: hypothetical protein AAF191_11395 [Verrucomicrobiota bacterium]
MNTTGPHSHVSQSSPSLRKASFLALLVSALLSSSSFAQSEVEGTDPTRASQEMEEILRVLRASEERSAEEAASEVRSGPTVHLAGLVVSGRQSSPKTSGSAILRIGDSHYLANQGQTIAHENRHYLVRTANAQEVSIQERGGEELVLRSTPPPNAIGAELDLIELSGVPLALAVRAISDQTGFRFAPSSEAHSLPVNLYLRDVNVAEAMDTLVLTHQLYMSDVPGAQIFRLHTAQEFARNAGSFRDERTHVFTLKYPNARDIAIAIGDLFGDRVRLASQLGGEGEPGEYLTEDLEQRMERFDVIDARGQGFGIDSGGQGSSASRSLISRFNNSSFSGNSRSFRNQTRQRTAPQGGRTDFENAQLTVEDGLSPEEIAALEAGDQQVIEETLRASADIFVTVIDRLNKVMVRTLDERTMQEIADLIEALDVPTPLVLLEVKILEITLDRGLDTAFDWSFQEGNGSGFFLHTGPLPLGGGDLVFQYLSGAFEAQIRLLQRANKLTTLGKPMLLTANNEVSRLFIGEEVPLNRNFQGGETVVTDGGSVITGSNTDVEFRPVGSTLLITPNINDDRTVTLRVLQEESRVVEDGAEVLVPNQGGGFSNTTIDTVASQTASGTFVARDRETIAVGGMITERLESRRSQIPILGDIPIAGRLARNQQVNRERTEIVLLLTPHIIKTPGEGGVISRELIQKSSFHPNAPEGEGKLNAFVPPNVLSTESEDYKPLRKVQDMQLRRTEKKETGEVEVKKATSPNNTKSGRKPLVPRMLRK